MTYHPKASMCIVCQHRNGICSQLDFKSMQAMEKYQQDGKDLGRQEND